MIYNFFKESFYHGCYPLICSATWGSVAASVTLVSRFCTLLPSSLGIIKPYPPSFLLYKIFTSPGKKISNTVTATSVRSASIMKTELVVLINKMLHSSPTKKVI